MSALASVAMVSGTPSCSLSSIAVAPISWTERQKCLDMAEGHGFDILEILSRQMLTFKFCQSVFYLPKGLSQSAHRLGREQPLCRPWPAGHLCVSWTRLRTRQHWCLCNTSTASARWRWQIPEVQKHRLCVVTGPAQVATYCTWMWHAVKTHIQCCLGRVFVFGAGGKSLIDYSVGPFAVQANTTIRKLHWKWQETERRIRGQT